MDKHFTRTDPVGGIRNTYVQSNSGSGFRFEVRRTRRVTQQHLSPQHRFVRLGPNSESLCQIDILGGVTRSVSWKDSDSKEETFYPYYYGQDGWDISQHTLVLYCVHFRGTFSVLRN